MATPRSLELLKRIYLLSGIGTFVLYILLMAFVFPWWHASNHPLILTLGAPSDAQVELQFNGQGETLPVVPLGEPESYHWYWATELPARPSYELSLQFPAGTSGEWVLSEIKVLTLSPERGEHLLDLETLAAISTEGISIRRLQNGWGITAQPGTRLVLPDALPKPTLAQWIGSGVMASFTYLIFAAVILLLIGTALRFPDGIRARKHFRSPLETAFILLGVIFGGYIHLYLVGNSMPDYWPADSTSYAMKAVSLATEWSYDTGTHEYELNRMPGFPLFMALVFKLIDWDLHSVAVAQGAVFCLSILLLALSLRKLVNGYLIGPFAFVALVSPPAVWASRQMATESTFASCWIAALAIFIYLLQHSGRKRLIAWVFFGVVTTAAIAIRPNGILLFCLPGFMVTGTIWWAYSFRGKAFWRLPQLWQTIGQVAIPAVMAGLFILAWSWRNHESRGYAKPTDLTEVVWANAPFFAGIFDIRAASDRKEMEWMVTERANSGYWFHGWSLRKYRFREITNQYQNIEDESILALEQELAAFNAKSNDLIPLRAKVAAYGRIAGWGLFFPKIGAYTTDPLNQNYKVLSKFPNEARAEQVARNLRWATRNVSQNIMISEAFSDKWIYHYNNTIVGLYPWIYRVLFLCALSGWLISMSERKYLAAVLISPYILNVFLNVYFMYIIGRYVQVLDVSLWMTALVGLACVSPHALQEPTTETDRRCIPPIRPKRLLKRFENEPGTPQ